MSIIKFNENFPDKQAYILHFEAKGCCCAVSIIGLFKKSACSII
jgi:hypothetical protein